MTNSDDYTMRLHNGPNGDLWDAFTRSVKDRLADWGLGLLCGLTAGIGIGVMIA